MKSCVIKSPSSGQLNTQKAPKLRMTYKLQLTSFTMKQKVGQIQFLRFYETVTKSNFFDKIKTR